MNKGIKNLWLWGHVTKPLLDSEWISRLKQYKRLIVGFSGGLDSTVLLHALLSQPSLVKKIVAVHINHGISSNAEYWQRHCESFCINFNINFKSETVEFDRSANIEEGARIARYEVFSSLVTKQDCLLLAHHLDDQAETLLLQLFRGAGVDGLAAMPEFGQLGMAVLARPFLKCSREQLEHYAAFHDLNWIEDESNQDVSYSRNYLRQQIMPILRKKWPGVVGNIARTATHCQQARANLDDLALQDSPELLEPAGALFIEPLKTLTIERITNVLRLWLKKNQIQLPSTLTFQRLIHEVIFASPDAMPLVSWDKIQVRRYKDHLYLDKKTLVNMPSQYDWTDFPQPLVLSDNDVNLTAQRTNQGVMVPQGAKLTIRYRQGGELFSWHGQTKHLKKLFQEWKVPPWLRDSIPLVYINDQLAVVVGYAVSDLFFTKDSAKAWEILNY